ncbi:YbjQ family protein [Intestinibacter sp.]|uniref:YbjQ family protein n=1 Tax=Intestinibacter sp. TaxID=1965304 RepID=UPI002A90EA7A|nr:YbjQ family protein [Intestinibacter sp.]MDY5212748.1 YbjQ family protein [Intestinibacter sp.]
MIVVTTDQIQGKEIKEILGVMSGGTVQSKNIGKDIGAGLKGLVGGEMKSYTAMMEEAREIAMQRLIDKASKAGANAIVGMRFMTSSIIQGASEVIAYGTAVVVE